MSAKTAPIEIIAPGLLGPMPGVEARRRYPFLDTLLGRARRLDAPLQTDTTRALLDLWGLPQAPNAEPPSGALAALGLELPAELRTWTHADPVYLKPDQDSLLLFDQSHFELDEAECAAFRDAFNQHFADRDIRLHIAWRRHWFLSLPAPMRVRTRTLEEVSGRSIKRFMPSGPEGRACRALLNEIQMLFHGLEVNRRRADNGRLPVSGLWLHGFGELPDGETITPPARRTLGAHPVLKGLVALAESHHEDTQQEPLRPGDLIVWDDILPAVLDADPESWSKAVERFSRWLQPQVETAARKQRFLLRPANGEVFAFTPASVRRFWKRRGRLVESLDEP